MTLSRNKNAALGFIFFTVLIDVIGFGIIFPIIPKLISQLIHADISTAAEYGGWLTFAYAFMQFIFAPVLGNLSDRFGRRPVLLISLFTLGIDCIFLAYAPTITWLFVGRIIGGMTGGSYSVAAAYVADISTPEKRSQNFGLLNAAFGVGFIIGPVLGGLLVRYGTHVPFLVAAGLSLLNVAYGYFVLPESLPKEKRRSFRWKRANPIGAFMHLKRFPAVSGLIVALILIYIAGHSMESVWTYYTIEKFNWNEEWIGYSLGFLGLTLAIVQGWLCRYILPKIGDKKGVYLGLMLECLTFILFAFASEGWMIFAFTIPYALSGIASPALQAILSNQIPDTEQGELQGGLAALVSATAIVGPPVMTTLFAMFSGKVAGLYFPGMPFLFSGFLILIGIIIVRRNFRS